MRIQRLATDQLLSTLKTLPTGLTSAQAAQRLREFGRNVVEEPQRTHLLVQFGREFTHFFALILWVGAALALVAEHFEPDQGMARLAVAIVGVILVNGVFSFWQEFKADRAAAALRQLLPQRVQAMRDGQLSDVAATDLVPGDVLVLSEGGLVPADCRVLDVCGLRVNTATVTGESLPRACRTEPSDEESPLFARNLVLAGTSVVSGQGHAVVYATGMRTEFGRIAKLTQATDAGESPLQREIARLSRIVAALATGMGVVVFFVSHAIGLPIWESLLFAIGIIVANVPEGLLPTVTLSLAMATQRMARRHALVRHLPAVETLGSTTTICCDKTGTLTQNRMTVTKLWVNGRVLDRAELQPTKGQGDAEPGEAQLWGAGLLWGAALCHDLHIQGDKRTGDPMEIALVELATELLGPLPELPREGELPFDTDRKRMSVVVRSPKGLTLYCKGALERVLPTCSLVQGPNGPVPLDDTARTAALTAQDQLANAGLRVLAMAHLDLEGEVPTDEKDLVFDGLVALEDPARPEVAEAIARCHHAGIRIILITGDHPHTAVAIARQIGVFTATEPVRVILGDELRSLSPEQLQLALDDPGLLFARAAAEQKMLVVKALQQKGEIVAVTGDGVNDAPALQAADIGIAMGIAGTDVAKAAADLILLDDNFSSIVAAIEEGRAVFDNIRKFLTYILTSNIPELVPYLAFVLLRVPLPLTIMQILAVDLGTDLLPALALGAEKPDPAVMDRPPRPRSERLLTWGVLARAYLFLGALEAAAAMALYFYVLRGGGWVSGDLARDNPLYLQATTACLTAIVVAQMVNLLLCRHPTLSLWSRSVPGNRWLLPALAVELAAILLLVYTPLGRWGFGTAPLGWRVWAVAAGLAVAIGAAEELRKAWVRRAARRKHAVG